MTANRRLGATGPAVFPMALGCMAQIDESLVASEVDYESAADRRAA